MDIHRLEVFCKVVELQSFTRAGEEIYLSQSTVSEHIRSLETILEEKLVDRLNRKVLPTPVGRILYGYAKEILRMRLNAIQAITAFRGRVAGLIPLGASTIPGTYYLPEYIGTFREQHPDIRVNLNIASSRTIADEVLAGECEAGMIGAKWNDYSLDWQEIFMDELILCVHSGHPWRHREEIDIKELAKEPFILRERGSGTRKVMMDFLADHGFKIDKLQVAAEMNSTETIRRSIKAGIGISILSRQAVLEDLANGSLSVVPIKGIQFYRPFYLITAKKRELSPGCSLFLDHLRITPAMYP
ncbi:MAG: selenium metabolism-associated LysR family transcriptional regulator [Desulfobulbaceae bacterium]|nr:selenium metabolism-associated LysR family transcriptional regulator [Desulfobulbaceae bacterium]